MLKVLTPPLLNPVSIRHEAVKGALLYYGHQSMRGTCRICLEDLQEQDERFHFGVISEKLKLTKSSIPSLITFNCDIKHPKGFLSLYFTFNWPFGYIKD